MKCGNCGAEIKSGNFCTQCGAMHTVVPTPEPVAPTAPVYVQEPVVAPTQVYIQEPVAPPTQVYVPSPPIPREYRPLTPWEYVFWSFQFSLPIIGTLLLIFHALGGSSNLNLRSYAQSYFCTVLVVLIIMLVITLILALTGTAGVMAIAEQFDF